MKSPTHINCPSCHTPVAQERYEQAYGPDSKYLVCPECDYTFLLAGVLGDKFFGLSAGADPELGAVEAEVECSTLN